MCLWPRRDIWWGAMSPIYTCLHAVTLWSLTKVFVCHSTESKVSSFTAEMPTPHSARSPGHAPAHAA